MENSKQSEKMLYRSDTNRVIFGVCGGLGEYFSIDPLLFRIIFILLVLGAGSGVIIYLILALLIPLRPLSAPAGNTTENIDVKKRIHELAEELRHLKRTSGKGSRRGAIRLFVGLLILIIGFGIFAQDLNLFPGFYFNFYSIFRYFWPVLIILIGLSILSREVY